MYILDFFKNMIKKVKIATMIYLLINTLIIGAIIHFLNGYNIALDYLIGFGVYMVFIMIALSPVGECILRIQTGCWRIGHGAELNYIEPLFQEVYSKAKQVNPSIPDNVKLYINDEEQPNAFATGRKTICVTRGMLDMPEEQIKACLAHEFAHLANKDTDMILLISVGNLFISSVFLAIRMFIVMVHILLKIFLGLLPDTFETLMVAMVETLYAVAIFIGVDLVTSIWTQLGVLLVLKSSGNMEYLADEFAFNLGYGNELSRLLGQVRRSKGKGLFVTLSGSHPSNKKRIKKLNEMAINNSMVNEINNNMANNRGLEQVHDNVENSILNNVDYNDEVNNVQNNIDYNVIDTNNSNNNYLENMKVVNSINEGNVDNKIVNNVSNEQAYIEQNIIEDESKKTESVINNFRGKIISLEEKIDEKGVNKKKLLMGVSAAAVILVALPCLLTYSKLQSKASAIEDEAELVSNTEIEDVDNSHIYTEDYDINSDILDYGAGLEIDTKNKQKEENIADMLSIYAVAIDNYEDNGSYILNRETFWKMMHYYFKMYAATDKILDFNLIENQRGKFALIDYSDVLDIASTFILNFESLPRIPTSCNNIVKYVPTQKKYLFDVNWDYDSYTLYRIISYSENGSGIIEVVIGSYKEEIIRDEQFRSNIILRNPYIYENYKIDEYTISIVDNEYYSSPLKYTICGLEKNN